MPIETHAALIDRVNASLAKIGRRSKLLSDIAWPRATEEQFFRDRCQKLPEVRYELDRDQLRARAEAFESLANSIEGDDHVQTFLRNTVRSYADANRLLLAVGTVEFFKLSRELYGSARTRFVGTNLRNIDLAEHLLDRLKIHGHDGSHPSDDEEESELWSAEAFAQWLRDRSKARRPPMQIEVTVDRTVSAKVIAGKDRVRVRGDATFSPWEAEGLWAHEIETHVLTAQNGAAQMRAPFLSGGGPRSTRTQEGLAVFAELDARRLSPARMHRLAMRVKLVAAAEDGADFIELYRMLRAHGSSERDAYLDAQRVCRGGRVEGGAPFTKDACYLAGMVEVYSFLSAFARGGHRDELEMLLAGRCAIDDLDALVVLRREGLLDPPKYVPPWLANWRGLLPYFAFASFFSGLNLSSVEARFSALIELARAQHASDPPSSSYAPSERS
jgi:uncharacterized protein (TIGR02421 family)